jgi:hypothetical protein
MPAIRSAEEAYNLTLRNQPLSIAVANKHRKLPWHRSTTLATGLSSPVHILQNLLFRAQ